MKIATTHSTGAPAQAAIAAYLEEEGYDRFLRRIRKVYREKVEQVRAMVLREFPADTRVTDPRGGFVLWVQLPDGADADKLFLMAQKEKIIFAPGTLFSVGDKFRHCLRLNATFASERHMLALRKLGQMAHRLGHQSSHA